ncbi:orexin receptor type 2-like [Paramacrobiotus metropolitanus]|uniref:orexin receptor type 2-like n=1 Tax=Paramacrobiotus metropolitanus TaxID=2943436 RepID=UPI0024460965|nr:orexin receptor type 2-like [Paramacrobiotus metropolitanus]
MMDEEMDNSSIWEFLNSTDGLNGAQSHPTIYPPKWLIITAYVIVHTACIFGNALVLAVVSTHPKMRGITNFLLAQLAIADLSVALFCTGQHYILLIGLEDWIFGFGPVGQGLCKAYGFVRNVAYMSSINVLMLIALERFLAIVHPFSSRTFLMSRTSLKIMVILGWLISCIVSLPNILGYEAFPNFYVEYINGVPVIINQTICSRNYNTTSLFFTYINWTTYDFITFALWYAVPATLMTVCYVAISRRLWSSSKPDLGVNDSFRHTVSLRSYTSVSSHPSSPVRTPEREAINGGFAAAAAVPVVEDVEEEDRRRQSCVIHSRRKVVRILMTVVAVFVLCWLPLHVRKAVFYFHGYEDWIGDVLMPVSDWLINLNSALNPLIYTVFSRKFRRCAYDMLTCQAIKQRWVRRPMI